MSRLILLVEDNPTDEKLTVMAFQKCSVAHELVILRDGAETLDYLFGTGTYADRGPGTPPHLILLDLRLPRIGGFDVIRRVRASEITRLVPIVVLTASKEEEDIAMSYGLGANAYVRKPVDFRRFVEAVDAMAVFWLTLNEYGSRSQGYPAQ